MPTATPTVVAAAADAASPKPRDTGHGHPRRCRRDRKSRAAGANARDDEGSEESARPEPDPHPQVEVEYVPEKPDLGAFVAVFEKFSLTEHTAAAPVEGALGEGRVRPMPAGQLACAPLMPLWFLGQLCI